MADQNDNRFDRVSTVAKAALALGAGAAFLYRGGGDELLSKGLKRTSYALNEATQSLSSHTLKDMNGQGKTVINNALKTFKESFDNFSDTAISLRIDSNNSLLNTLQNAYSLSANRNSVLQNMFTQEVFIPNLKRELQDNLADVPNRKVNNIVDRIMSHMSDTLERIDDISVDSIDNFRFSDQFKADDLQSFSQEQQELMEQIVHDRLLLKENDAKLFAAEHQELIDNMINEMVDVDALSEKFGSVGKESKGQKFFDKVLNDSQATVRDLIDYSEKNPGAIDKVDFINKNGDSKTFIQELKDLSNRDSKYLDLYVDPSLRINGKGELLSFAEFTNMEHQFENSLLHTLPGKLMRPLETRVYSRSASNNIYLPAGSVQYQLPKLLENNESTILQNSYVRLNNRGFRINNNALERIDEFDNLIPISGRYGSYPRLLKNMTGDMDVLERNRGFISKTLDMQTSPKMGPLAKAGSWLKKFTDPEYSPYIIESHMDIAQSITKDPSSYYDDMKTINKMFKASTKKLDKQSINIISNQINDSSTREIFDLLNLNDDNLVKTLGNKYIQKGKLTYLNEDLTSLIMRYKSDPKKGRSLISISEEVSQIGVSKKYTKPEYYTDMLRKELTKEGFMRYNKEYGTESLYNLINNSGLTAKQKNKANKLASWSIFQQTGELFTSSAAPKSVFEKGDLKNKLLPLFADQNETSKQFRETIKRIVKEDYTFSEDGPVTAQYKNLIEKANRPGEYLFVKKSINPFDIINAENKGQKAKAFLKQFTAGRNNMEDFTTATMYPYFMLHRLTDTIPALAFSAANTGSTLDLAKAIMTKRVLPVVGAVSAFSYLNFESRNLTGKSITEAAINSWSNFDIGLRSIVDKTGLSEDLKTSWYSNPALQYLSKEPYMTAQEKADWERNGYSPVRKGRWWGMSTSEFRGGKIEFFEPSLLKQVSTPWRDISLYGSEDEKWKHSWLPTPRHPLSPIRNLLDPYWLEKKHKYDRPYPITAPLFSEGTPWSAIGNATIGRVVKPQIQMHKKVLGRDLIDVRDIIEQENNRIKAKSQESIVTITGSNTATEETVPINSRNTNEGGFGSNTGGGGGGQGFGSSSGSGFNSGSGGSDSMGYGNQTDNHITLLDKLLLSTMDMGLAMPQLQTLNEQIKYKAYTRGTAQTTFAKRYDNMVATSTLDLVKDKEIRSELLNTRSRQEFVSDAGYSVRELSGIYGFMFEEFFPGKKRYRLENATNMTSFSSQFWDQSLGGTGGGIMEIARRFFPHADRDITNVNPIRNNMPSWMPENFRHGDPYAKVKKGEMRLPGAGYEAINNYKPDLNFKIDPHMIGKSKDELVSYFLNKSSMDEQFKSDSNTTFNVSQSLIDKTQSNVESAKKDINKLIQSGKINSGEFYSDFQRFKILADIAPYSQEYKEYKGKIKNKLSYEQEKEYYQVLDRVDRQSRQHDFFSYRYRNYNQVSQEGYIDTIDGSNFTLVGSNQMYSLAGVKLNNKKALQEKIASGMKIKIAYDKLDQQDPVIKAIVFDGANNINKDMIRSKLAERSVDSAIDTHAISTKSQQLRGAIMESIGHAPIPYFHNRFLKLETARESYENDQVYGTSYATWSHPIKGYIQPAFNIAIAANPVHAGLGTAAFATNLYLNEFTEKNVSTGIKKAAQVANLLITPGAFTGYMTGFGIKLNPSLAKGGMYAGSAIWSAGYLVTNAKNPITSVAAGTILGTGIANFMEKGTGKSGAKVGALLGLGLSLMRNPDMNLDKAFGKWIPKDTLKRWDMEEYFDRLEYLKYKSLYERSSQKALSKEGVSIKSILKDMEHKEKENEKNKDKLLNYRQKISNSYMKNTKYGQELLTKIEGQLLYSMDSVSVKAGEYTKSALAYKQAMDSTIYGLQENASWAQILRALPKNDRDYFLEFSKVKDEKERKKILKTVSPYKRRILQQLWGKKQDELESNNSYFSNHKLPGMFWNGWKPDVNMDHIKMKTIENEGMLLSDFGMYDSSLQEPGVRDVEGIRNYDSGTNILELKKNLFTSLSGIGLTGVEVSIEPSERSGIQMVTNFIRVSDYGIKQRINGMFGRTYY